MNIETQHTEKITRLNNDEFTLITNEQMTLKVFEACISMMNYTVKAITLAHTMLETGRRFVNSGIEQSTKLKVSMFDVLFNSGLESEEKVIALNHYRNLKQALKDRKNFASSNNGASILRNSAGVKASKAILTSSTEAYMHIENCNNRRSEDLIIILSDDV